ncbi:Concanavalin A-like lectin/glucanase, subgroup [Heracleum sosnowskyi]|uniref:Concanavalin A-like lectin/glucanase, subgroup n=1 Tax=Heracleum sosnowskyi TaxID=360622 RepID=A0AAD8HIC7_9APIA|nr:Concanavalin A-like lectin/glucanase, subgroup [Heracleum sosnowskyi]
MIPSSPTKVVVGIPLDVEDSEELLSWAIEHLAHPNDTVIALHVLVMKKRKTIRTYQTQTRRAKAFVISVLGGFAQTCQSKQVNLEAKVGFSSSIGRGLIEEAQGISADYILIGSSKNRTNRAPKETKRYCFDNAPEGCSLVLIGRREQPPQNATSKLLYNKDMLEKRAESESSPITVLSSCEDKSSSTEEDSSSTGESSITESPLSHVSKEPNNKKQLSPLQRISSFLLTPFALSGRKRIEAFVDKEKPQPLLKCFSYEEIAKATNSFHPEYLVAIGGYSEVYRGDLDDGNTIAVKRLAKDNTDQNKEKEFLMELGILGHVNHPNTARLVGCCVENGLYLIFNFYPNGTLASALHGKIGPPLEWPVRYKIALGIARDYEPQISDFGLAKWLPSKWTHHAVIPIEGTFGYLAPEYFMHGIVDEKTDVFAFGILLLEIITGRKPIDSSQKNILLWAKPLMESGNVDELADPSLERKYDMNQMERLILTASYCVRQSSIWRPSMAEVLQLLMYGQDSEAAENWRLPKFRAEEMDDTSLLFGYDLPSDIVLEDIL